MERKRNHDHDYTTRREPDDAQKTAMEVGTLIPGRKENFYMFEVVKQ